MFQMVALILYEMRNRGPSALSVFSALISDKQVLDSFLFKGPQFMGAIVNK